MDISENISLKEFTTFRIGGLARYFVRCTSLEELKQALVFAQEKQVPFFVLGGGSNVLMPDEGFPGLVIKIEIKGIEIRNINETTQEIIGGAGEVWDDMVKYAVDNMVYGLENLSWIPGSVGAAPVQNIGAYGVEIKDTLSWVEVFDSETKEIKIFKNAECEFGYRDSIFKKPEGKKYIILRVACLLRKNGVLNTSYRDIKAYIETHIINDVTLENVRDIVIDIRKRKLPDVALYGTAGSFFKNPIVSVELYKSLLEKYPTMPNYPMDTNKVKIPAAWILDNLCGFKGYRNGDVGVYQNQALVLVNFGSATAHEVKKLSDDMIACVKEKTSIELEREVHIIENIL